MPNEPYLVQCLDAKYDEPDEMLVLLCLFKEIDEPRIICFHRSDFHFKKLENSVPHSEMHKTADLWRGKNFNIVIEDDPDRMKINASNQSKYVEMFRNRVSQELTDVKEGLQDEKRNLRRYIGDLVERERQKSELNVEEMLEDEMAIRQRLSSVRIDR